MNPPNPFAVLGLPAWPDLENETVHAAWQAIAAQTHPDRADGGDLARYTQATAAYAELNTPWGRSEAYADIVEQTWADGRFDDRADDDPLAAGLLLVLLVPVVLVPQTVPLQEVLRIVAEIPARIRRGHAVRLLLRAAVIAGLCLAVLAFAPHWAYPHFGVAVLIGYFVLSAREDLAPPTRPVMRKGPESARK
jgi:hypothetical protein